MSGIGPNSNPKVLSSTDMWNKNILIDAQPGAKHLNATYRATMFGGLIAAPGVALMIAESKFKPVVAAAAIAGAVIGGLSGMHEDKMFADGARRDRPVQFVGSNGERDTGYVDQNTWQKMAGLVAQGYSFQDIPSEQFKGSMPGPVTKPR